MVVGGPRGPVEGNPAKIERRLGLHDRGGEENEARAGAGARGGLLFRAVLAAKEPFQTPDAVRPERRVAELQDLEALGGFDRGGVGAGEDFLRLARGERAEGEPHTDFPLVPSPGNAGRHRCIERSDHRALRRGCGERGPVPVKRDRARPGIGVDGKIGRRRIVVVPKERQVHQLKGRTPELRRGGGRLEPSGSDRRLIDGRRHADGLDFAREAVGDLHNAEVAGDGVQDRA